jgi:penicillin-binding protein 1A
MDGWPPKRFCIEGGKGGRTTIADALRRSLNTAAVTLAEKVGYPRVIDVARKLGISGVIGDYPAMVLGANEKTVLEMTAAYAAINNRGLFAKPVPFEEIYGPDGELLWSRRVDGEKPRRAVSSDVADAVTWMLQQVVIGGTGRAATLPDRPAAGKTGTAEGARDLWFIGSIPQLTTGIWLGYDQNLKTGSSSAAAATAWSAFMGGILNDIPVRPFPAKPVLTGRFIPYKAPKGNGKKKPEASALRREESWLSPEIEPSDGEGRSQPPVPEERPWSPPEGASPEPRRGEAPNESPAPRREAAAPSPQPTAPAPTPSPAPGGPSVVAPPPPPISAPPPP